MFYDCVFLDDIIGIFYKENIFIFICNENLNENLSWWKTCSSFEHLYTHLKAGSRFFILYSRLFFPPHNKIILKPFSGDNASTPSPCPKQVNPKSKDQHESQFRKIPQWSIIYTKIICMFRTFKLENTYWLKFNKPITGFQK